MKLFSDHIPDCRLIWDATALSAAMRDPFTYVVSINHGRKFSGGVRNPKFTFGQLWNEFVQLSSFAVDYLILTKQSLDEELLKDRIWEVMKQAILTTQLDESCYSDSEKQLCGGKKLFQCMDARVNSIGFIDPWGLVILPENNSPYVPQIEVGFLHDLGIETESGEPYLLAGYLDMISFGRVDNLIYPREIKTTRSGYGDYYINDKLLPSVQFRTYELIAKRALEDNNDCYSGILVDVCNVYKSQTPTITQRIKQHNDWEIDWWENQLKRCIKQFERLAKEGRLSLEVALSYDPEVNPEGLIRYRSENNPEPLAYLFDKNPLERQSMIANEMHQTGAWDPSITRDNEFLQSIDYILEGYK